MKTLTESIIGRKGVEKNPLVNARTRLRQGDIVYFEKSNLGPYLVVLDKNLYKRISQRLTSKDEAEKDGFLVRSQYRVHYTILLSGYDQNLRFIKNSEYNIAMILRGNDIPVSSEIEDVWDFIDIYHLSNLAEKFKVVFKNGRWIK